MIKLFSASLTFSRKGKDGPTVYVVAGYDNSAETPCAELVPFPEPGQRRTALEPWAVTLPEVNALLENGELSLGF